MAKLEFEFVTTGIQQASSAIAGLQSQLTGLQNNSNINLNVNTGGGRGGGTSGINMASDSILGLRNRLNELLRTYGSLSETQRNSSRVQNNLVAEINRLRGAVTEANREYDNLRRGTGRPIPSDSIVGMRNRLNELRRTYDNLSTAQRNSGRVQNNLVTEINRLNQAVSQAEQATGRFQRNVGNYQNGMRGANGVTMEFNRIIQDMPFGMMGIGNNIQQLMANWQTYAQQARAAAAANGTTITTFGMLRGVMSSFFSVGTLMTFAVSAITSAWTYYTMHQQKAAKSMREAKSEVDAFRESLKGLQAVQLASLNSYASEISRLETLTRIMQDTSNSTKERIRALKQLQEMYPRVFKNIDLEKAKNIETSDSYLALRESIMSAARAKAVYSRISTLEDQKLTLEYKKQQDQKNASDAERAQGLKEGIYESSNALDKLKISASDAVGTLIKSPWGSFKDAFGIEKMDTEADKFNKTLNETNNQLKDANDELTYLRNIAMESEKGDTGIQEKIKDAKERVKAIKEQYDYLQRISELMSGKQKDLDVFNLVGKQKDVEDLKWSYVDLFNELDKLEKKLNKEKNSKNKGIIQIAIDGARSLGEELKRLERVKIDLKWAEKYDEVLRKINERAGKLEIPSIEKDLRAEEKIFDGLFKDGLEAGAEFWDLFYKIGKGKSDAFEVIKGNWRDKALEQMGALNKSIEDVLSKSFRSQTSKGLANELKERTKQLRKAYDELMDMEGSSFDSGEFKRLELRLQAELELRLKSINIEKSNQDIRDYVDIANQGLNSIFSNLETNVNQFGFGISSVLFTIGDTFKNIIGSLNDKNKNKFIENLTQIDELTGIVNLKDNWKSITEDSTKMNQAVGVALSSVGSMLSSVVKKTSVAGQGISGALSGAGSMAATGNPWLIGAGAVIGGLSSIFGASKARKEEKLAKQQLDEQKKSNALLERMNALAYASQIIGSKTQYGIIHGVNRNEFGEITVRVRGQDLVTVLKKNESINGR